MLTLRDTTPSSRRYGFTLIEMMVAMVLFSFVLLALLTIFDFSDKLARAQTQITDVQQSLRTAQYDVIRLIRMAGRGPLPLRVAGAPGKQIPQALAVEVNNNVLANTQIGVTSGPKVVASTDVLTIRGVFGSGLYQVNHADPTTFTKTAGGGTIVIEDKTPTAVPQVLAEIIRTACDDIDEALVIVSPLDDSNFVVVELDSAATKAGTNCGAPSTVTSLTVTFKWSGGSNTAAYQGLSPPGAGGAFPAALTSVAFLGVLEEHRFYVREIYAVPNDATTRMMPRFSRARVFPGTNVVYRNLDNWVNDIADDIFDLQVAIGLDADDDGAILDSGDATDEWLYNHPGDDDSQAQWNTVAATGDPTRLFNLRLTTLARTALRDTSYQAPLLTLVEDHDYTVAPSTRFNQLAERRHRQRRLQTVIDMRNVS